MRKDKEEAFKLRKEGKTYAEISKLLVVSKGTLSFWFSKIDWSQELKNANHKFNYSPAKLQAMRQARRKNLDDWYARAEKEAEMEFRKYLFNPLFISGLMLYEGEGDHSRNSQVRIANTNPLVILTFKKFIEEYYREYIPRMRISLLLYPDLNPTDCVVWWRDALKDQQIAFHNPVVIQGRHKTRRLQYGVASLIISSKFLKVKILKSIDFAFKNMSVY